MFFSTGGNLFPVWRLKINSDSLFRAKAGCETDSLINDNIPLWPGRLDLSTTFHHAFLKIYIAN